MLEDWAGISPAALSGEKINDLSNLILMSTEVHEDFGSFTFWFEPTVRFTGRSRNEYRLTALFF